MFGLGPTELIIIAIIVLLIFGAKRLPDIGKGLGGAIKEFRNIKQDLSSDNAGDNRAVVVGAGVSSQNVVSSVPGCDGAVAWSNVVPTVSDNDGTVLVTKGT